MCTYRTMHAQYKQMNCHAKDVTLCSKTSFGYEFSHGRRI